MNARPFRILIAVVMLVYLALLTKNILFKHGRYQYYKNYFKREYERYSPRKGWKNANTIPFHTIRLYYRALDRRPKEAEINLFGNLIGFAPFGLLFPLLFRRQRNVFFVTFIGFLLSLGFESSQLLLGLGFFDVDDLILNTAGVFGGVLLYWILLRIALLLNLIKHEDLALD